MNKSVEIVGYGWHTLPWNQPLFDDVGFCNFLILARLQTSALLCVVAVNVLTFLCVGVRPKALEMHAGECSDHWATVEEGMQCWTIFFLFNCEWMKMACLFTAVFCSGNITSFYYQRFAVVTFMWQSFLYTDITEVCCRSKRFHKLLPQYR